MWKAAAATLVFVLAVAPGARAHIVYGTTSIARLSHDAELIVRARITDGARVVTRTAPPLRRTVIDAEVLEVVKGDGSPGSVTFAPHGHGVAEYARGEEVILFLEPLERVPELRATALAGLVRYVSLQEGPDKLALMASSRDVVLDAVRSYVAADALGTAEDRLEALGHVTARLLRTSDPQLAMSALRDLIAGAPADRATLEPLLDDPDVRIGIRMGLLAELERRHLVDASARWAHLLETTSGADRRAALRAAAAHPSPPVTAVLLRLLGGDAGDAALAAVSLGTAGNDAAVEPLARAMAADDPRLRLAAIRGLGGINTSASRETLALVADFHPDPATRRRAGAELAVDARIDAHR